jgi:hypothetical protein
VASPSIAPEDYQRREHGDAGQYQQEILGPGIGADCPWGQVVPG